jgi:hypothetical protein
MTTHGETHQDWKLELQAAYSISRLEEESRFEPHKHDCNRRLLWYNPPEFFLSIVSDVSSPLSGMAAALRTYNIPTPPH